jgi:ribonucleotide reductase alpha subunit
LWSDTLKNHISLSNGSIQNIDGIPDAIKSLYKTVWEIKQKSIIEMARDRQPFIDQSQSMNLFIEDLSFKKFNALQFYGWKCGLKTGSYYIRTRVAMMSQKFTISPEVQREIELNEILKSQEKAKTVVDDEQNICLMCSS